jgi:hypothetical protein
MRTRRLLLEGLCFAYWVVRRLFELLILFGRSERAKELEILVLRHELPLGRIAVGLECGVRRDAVAPAEQVVRRVIEIDAGDKHLLLDGALEGVADRATDSVVAVGVPLRVGCVNAVRGPRIGSASPSPPIRGVVLVLVAWLPGVALPAAARAP